MSSLFTIQLKKMIFHGQHGMYGDEKLTGNTFEVSVDIAFNQDGDITSINQTIDYADVFSIIQKRMQEPARLLETLAQQIVSDISITDNRICRIAINIVKKNPPIPNFSGEVAVSFEKEFSR